MQVVQRIIWLWNNDVALGKKFSKSLYIYGSRALSVVFGPCAYICIAALVMTDVRESNTPLYNVSMHNACISHPFDVSENHGAHRNAASTPDANHCRRGTSPWGMPEVRPQNVCASRKCRRKSSFYLFHDSCGLSPSKQHLS